MPRMPQEAASFKPKRMTSNTAKPRASTEPSVSLASAASKDSPRDKYSEQLGLLSACFPDWNEEDLVSVLVDLNGDVELAAHRISEGFADQWSVAGAKKAAPKKEVRQQQPRSRFSSRPEASQRPTVPSRPAPLQQRQVELDVDAALTWAVSADSWVVSSVKIQSAEIKTEAVVEEPEPQVEATPAATEGTPAWNTTAPPSHELEERHVEGQPIAPAVENDASSEEFVVLLPKMTGARRMASEIEPSPVLLPPSYAFKAAPSVALQFGQAQQPQSLVFGEPKQQQPSKAGSYSAYTTTSVDALQGPLEQQQAYEMNSPPGLNPVGATGNTSPYSHHSQQQAPVPPYYQRSPAQQHQQQSSAYRHGYDQQQESGRGMSQAPYRQQYEQPHHHQQSMRYDASAFNSRYAPYGQHSIDDAFAAVSIGNSSYYGGRGAPSGAIGGSYYGAHYAHQQHQMMYGGAAAAEANYQAAPSTNTFTPASARYHPSGSAASSVYGAQQGSFASSSSSAYPSGSAHPTGRSPSRMTQY